MSIFKIENTLVDYWKKQRVGTNGSAEMVSSLSGTCHPELVRGACGNVSRGSKKSLIRKVGRLKWLTRGKNSMKLPQHVEGNQKQYTGMHFLRFS